MESSPELFVASVAAFSGIGSGLIGLLMWFLNKRKRNAEIGETKADTFLKIAETVALFSETTLKLNEQVTADALEKIKLSARIDQLDNEMATMQAQRDKDVRELQEEIQEERLANKKYLATIEKLSEKISSLEGLLATNKKEIERLIEANKRSTQTLKSSGSNGTPASDETSEEGSSHSQDESAQTAMNIKSE